MAHVKAHQSTILYLLSWKVAKVTGWWMVDLLQNNEHLLGYSPLEIEVLMSPFIFGLPMCSVSIFLNGYGLLYV